MGVRNKSAASSASWPLSLISNVSAFCTAHFRHRVSVQHVTGSNEDSLTYMERRPNMDVAVWILDLNVCKGSRILLEQGSSLTGLQRSLPTGPMSAMQSSRHSVQEREVKAYDHVVERGICAASQAAPQLIPESIPTT